MEQKNKREELTKLILKESKLYTLNKGDSIFKIAGKYNSICFLMEGLIIKGHHFGEEDIYVDIISKGEFITLREVFANTPNVDIALVHSDVAIVYLLTIDSLKKIMKENIWVEDYLKSEFDREINIYEFMSIKSTRYTAKERIVKLIVRLVEKFGINIGNEILIELNITHVDIAKLSHSSRQTVTSFLNRLRDLNYIYYDRRRLLVRDVDKLRSISKEFIANL